jgi:predicted DNA-binding protein with PD1-like motif
LIRLFKTSNMKIFFLSIIISITIATARAQEQYIKPGSIPVQKNKAPGLKVRLLGTSGDFKNYVIVFAKGDDILSGLTAFAEQNHVTCAHFTGIGAVSAATLGCYDRDKQMYHIIPIKGQAETVSFIGNIATYKDKPTVHVHLSVAQTDGTIKGGHLFEGYVWPTLEIFLTSEPVTLNKKLEPETGFVLLEPDVN